MSTFPEGSSPKKNAALRFYDVDKDIFREATQDDLDRLVRVAASFGTLSAQVERLGQCRDDLLKRLRDNRDSRGAA